RRSIRTAVGRRRLDAGSVCHAGPGAGGPGRPQHFRPSSAWLGWQSVRFAERCRSRNNVWNAMGPVEVPHQAPRTGGRAVRTRSKRARAAEQAQSQLDTVKGLIAPTLESAAHGLENAAAMARERGTLVTDRVTPAYETARDR